MKNKKLLPLGLVAIGTFALLKAFIPKCLISPVHTRPDIRYIVNPCSNCKVNGGSNEPPTYRNIR